MIKKFIWICCLIVSLTVFLGCHETDNEMDIKDAHFFVDDSKYEILVTGGQITYIYYANYYYFENIWIVISEYVDSSPYADSSFVHTNRLMLPSGITIIRSRK